MLHILETGELSKKGLFTILISALVFFSELGRFVNMSFPVR